MDYKIQYGDTLTADGFGFLGQGEITIRGGMIRLSGRRRWPQWVRFILFLGLTIVPLFLLGFGLAVIPAWIIVHYLCISSGSLELRLTDIKRVSRSKKRITFRAPIKPKCWNLRKSVLKAISEDEARAIEAALLARQC